MKKLILSTVALLLVSTQAFADIDPIHDDLSGAWRVECGFDSPVPLLKKFEFLATKTSIKATYFDEPVLIYSILFQNPRENIGEDFWFPFFAFTIGTYKGEK